MLTHRIVFKRPDGGVRVYTPDPNPDPAKLGRWAILTGKIRPFSFSSEEEASAWIAAQVACFTRQPEDGTPAKTEAQVRPYVEALTRGDLTDEDAFEVIARLESLPGETWRIVPTDSLPASRDFRDAWTDDQPTPTVDVDMTKARAIHMDRLRVLRNEKLAALDLDSLRAIESGDKARLSAISASKQELRDLPTSTDLSKIATPEELAAFMPDALKS